MLARRRLTVLARAHQRLIWDRQRQVNRLRSVLGEFYPAALNAFGTDLARYGARAFYHARRANGETHAGALRALSNRLVGVLDGCLRHHCVDNENIAWARTTPTTETE